MDERNLLLTCFAASYVRGRKAWFIERMKGIHDSCVLQLCMLEGDNNKKGWVGGGGGLTHRICIRLYYLMRKLSSKYVSVHVIC